MRAAALALLTMLCAPAVAQQEPPPGESPIISGMRLMMAARAEEADEKATPVGDQRFGALPAGQTASLTVPLAPGKAHIIVAACDFDCVKIDLKAFDEAGSLIAEHKGGGDVPALNIAADKATSLKVELTMTECSQRACRAGVGVWQRSAP